MAEEVMDQMLSGDALASAAADVAAAVDNTATKKAGAPGTSAEV